MSAPLKSARIVGLVAVATLPLLLGMGRPALPMVEGQLAYRLGQYDRAYTLFSQQGDQPDAALWRGNAAYRLGRSEEALAAWKAASAQDETAADAQSALSGARGELTALIGLLDRYGALRDGLSDPAAWRDLAGAFDALNRSAGTSLVGRRAALMAADSFAHAGDTEAARRRFEAARDAHPGLGDWVLWRLAEVDAPRRQAHLEALVARYPGSPLRFEARVSLAESISAEASRTRALEAVVREAPGSLAAERATYMLAQLPGADRPARLLRYWNAFPDGRYLDSVVAELEKAPGLSRDTLYRLGSYHYFKSDYGPATRFFARVGTPMARYRAGRSFWGLNDLDKAVATLAGVARADRALAGKAHLTIGQIEAQRGRWPQAIAAYRKAAGLGGEAAVTARWRLSRALREQGKAAEAARLEQQILRQAPWSEEALTIGWSRFWSAFQAGRTQDAIVNGKRLAAHHPQHPDGQAAQYWLGRMYERQGRRADATAAYAALKGHSPNTYYGWRASHRTLALTGGRDPWFRTEGGRDVVAPPIRWADLLPARERALLAGEGGTPLPSEMLAWPEPAKELLFLRQFDVPDRLAARSQSPNLKAWMSFLQRRYRQAIREEKGEPRLSYPLGFAPMLVAAASRNRVDPLLLAALVREESRFDPTARSWVGATGLAQLMPFTADWVVKQVPDVAGRPLTDPNTNLQLGAWYLAYTHRTFDGGSVYAVAAYNGGPGAVAKWRRAFSGDPDAWVETIPYPETRLYVKKVFTSYWNYVKLYGNSN